MLRLPLPAWCKFFAVLTKTPTLTHPHTRPHPRQHLRKYITHVCSWSFQRNRYISDFSFVRIGGRAKKLLRLIISLLWKQTILNVNTNYELSLWLVGIDDNRERLDFTFQRWCYRW